MISVERENQLVIDYMTTGKASPEFLKWLGREPVPQAKCCRDIAIHDPKQWKYLLTTGHHPSCWHPS